MDLHIPFFPYCTNNITSFKQRLISNTVNPPQDESDEDELLDGGNGGSSLGNFVSDDSQSKFQF
jgi:hypothetical protein